MNRNLLKSGAALVLAAALFSCGKERLEPSSLNASQPAPGMEQNAPEAGLLMPQLQPRLSTIQYDGQPFLTFTRDLSGRITKVDGGEHITTYTYGNGQVQIDRFRPFSNDSLFRYTAVLNSKGAITSMSGRIYGETGEVYEAKYTFFYNSYGRLTGMSKVYALWGETTYVTYTYGWTGSDLTSCTMSSNGKFLGKKGYQYANALPDKRGVWND
ncbi:MAG TPA: hypothetical protein VHK69_10050, partial [Chitinophagaceae bacterium]|nr:hypothetical protein [Chitinophagaceae bacterium]